MLPGKRDRGCHVRGRGAVDSNGDRLLLAECRERDVHPPIDRNARELVLRGREGGASGVRESVKTGQDRKMVLHGVSPPIDLSSQLGDRRR